MVIVVSESTTMELFFHYVHLSINIKISLVEREKDDQEWRQREMF